MILLLWCMLLICLQKQWFILYHCWIESLESVLLLSLSLPVCLQTITGHSRKDFKDSQSWFWFYIALALFTMSSCSLMHAPTEE